MTECPKCGVVFAEVLCEHCLAAAPQPDHACICRDWQHLLPDCPVHGVRGVPVDKPNAATLPSDDDNKAGLHKGEPARSPEPVACEECGVVREETTLFIRDSQTGEGGFMLKPCRKCTHPGAGT